MKPYDVILAARSWLGTPYHHMARVKGAGVDCGQVIIAAFMEAGCVPPIETGFYTHDWHFHQTEERYLGFVEDYLGRVDEGRTSLRHRIKLDPFHVASPADVLVFKVGNTFSHGAIVTDWPNVLHASQPAAMVEEVSILGTEMEIRESRIYRFGGFE